MENCVGQEKHIWPICLASVYLSVFGGLRKQIWVYLYLRILGQVAYLLLPHFSHL